MVTYHAIKLLLLVYQRLGIYVTPLERFHSRGQRSCKLIGTKQNVYIRQKLSKFYRLQPRSKGPLSSSLEKVPWLRMVTCLLAFGSSRKMIRGRGRTVKVCFLLADLLSPAGSGICNFGRTHSEGIGTFDSSMHQSSA